MSSLEEFIRTDLSNHAIKIISWNTLKNVENVEYFTNSLQPPEIHDYYPDLDTLEQMDLKSNFRKKRKNVFGEIIELAAEGDFDDNEQKRLGQKYRRLIHLHHFDELAELVATFGSEMGLQAQNGHIFISPEEKTDPENTSEDQSLRNESCKNEIVENKHETTDERVHANTDKSASIETLSDESFNLNEPKISLELKNESLSGNEGSKTEKNLSSVGMNESQVDNYENSATGRSEHIVPENDGFLISFDKGEKFVSQWENPKIVAQFNRHAYNFDFKFGKISDFIYIWDF